MRRALLALLIGTAALGATAGPHCPVTAPEGTAPLRRGGETAPRRAKVRRGGGDTLGRIGGSGAGTHWGALGRIGAHGRGDGWHPDGMAAGWGHCCGVTQGWGRHYGVTQRQWRLLWGGSGIKGIDAVMGWGGTEIGVLVWVGMVTGGAGLGSFGAGWGALVGVGLGMGDSGLGGHSDGGHWNGLT